MDIELAYSIVDQFVAAGVDSVTWTGGGEPTLYPGFDQVIAHTEGRLAQGLYTHGGHINVERAELLKRALTFAYVSLDAADAVSYKRWKGVDRFEAACEGIRRLVAAPGGATVGVGYLVTAGNWRGISTAVQLVRSLGADYIQFRPTILYSQTEPDRLDEDLAWIDEAMPSLQWAAEQPGVEVDLERFRMYQGWTGHGYQTCYWSGLQTCVTPNGKVWECVNRREHPSAEIGDLSVESFAAIWARHRPCAVNGDCRVLCRGHLPNLELAEIMAPREHAAFV